MSSQSNSPPNNLVKEALALHESNLISYATHLLGGDEERARDVVQDTLLKLHLADQDKIRDSLKSWLYAVCRNRAFDILRKEQRLTFTDDNETLDWLDEYETDPSKDADTDEMLRQIWSTIEQLPNNQREVIKLKFQHDLSYKEISQITKLSVTNVGFLLHTAIKRLRKLMNHALSEF